MISCFVVGNPAVVAELSIHIQKVSLSLKGIAGSFAEGLNGMRIHRPDIVFIGVDLFKKHQEEFNLMRQISCVIIVSDRMDDAFEAFEFQVFDYLVTPVSYTRFVKSIEKFGSIGMRPYAISEKHRVESIQDAFFVKVDSKGMKEILIKYSDLVFVEAMQNYVNLYVENGRTYLSYNTLKEMEENLPRSLFIRIHKSYIINDSKITSVEGNVVCLNDNVKWRITVGNTFKTAFLQKKNKKVISAHKGRCN